MRRRTGYGNTLSRGFDCSAVGADFVDEVHILTTPDAALSSGAIGATAVIRAWVMRLLRGG